MPNYDSQNRDVFEALIVKLQLLHPQQAQAAATAIKEYLVPLRQAGIRADDGTTAYPAKKDGSPSFLDDSGHLAEQLEDLDNPSNYKIEDIGYGFELELTISVEKGGEDYGAIQQEEDGRVWFDISSYEAQEAINNAMIEVTKKLL